MLGPATSRARMSSRLHPTHEHTEEGGLLIARRLGRLGHAFHRTTRAVVVRLRASRGGAARVKLYLVGGGGWGASKPKPRTSALLLLLLEGSRVASAAHAD